MRLIMKNWYHGIAGRESILSRSLPMPKRKASAVSVKKAPAAKKKAPTAAKKTADAKKGKAAYGLILRIRGDEGYSRS